MKVEEVMSTDLIFGYVPGTIKDALKILGDNNVSGMPILKKDTKKIVGILTRTDIFRNPDEEQLALVMSKNICSVDKDDQLKEAAKLLFEKRIHGLPVLNKKKNLVGVISPRDIVRIISEKKDVSQVKDYYTRYVVPVYQDTPINVVMEIIKITNENALPILNDELKLGGIVSDGDLFKLSHIRESVSQTDLGMGGDEDQWTWEGIRDTIRLHYSTSEVTLPDVPVKEIMISNVKKAFENTTVSEVAETMIKHDISHIPVVDSNDKLIGMVTDLDLMKCMF
jgi:CBS domain-containing protein